MKQVVFAIALLAMASLTGCLNTEDSPVDENIDTTDDSTSDTTEDNSDTTDDTKDDELIEPVGTDGGYTPPENSNIRVDKGVIGYWTYDEPFEFVDCTTQGYTERIDWNYVYCDLDSHQDYGPQVWVNKTGKTITVECIKHYEGDYCKDHSTEYYGAWFVFTSAEGFQERIYVDLSTYREWYDESDTYQSVTVFFEPEFTLKFEPISFTIDYWYRQSSDPNVSDLYFPEKSVHRTF